MFSEPLPFIVLIGGRVNAQSTVGVTRRTVFFGKPILHKAFGVIMLCVHCCRREIQANKGGVQTPMLMMIETRVIDEVHKQDINIPNQPFSLWGRMVPSYQDGKWSHTVEKFAPENVSEMCFPDENYDFAAMNGNSTFIGAYDSEKCVGLAIMQEGFLKYMYLYDLKVNQNCQGQGVGAALIEKAKDVAREKGYRGIYAQGQDNNLSACLFYLKRGFRIGGLDTDVYKGTSQEGKADILFYQDI